MAPAVASSIDDDATLQTFDGTPVQMAYWFQHTGDKLAELMERGAITLLERGIAVTPRTQVVVYNRLHMLCRQAVTDLSVIEYSYKNPPPGAAHWAAQLEAATTAVAAAHEVERVRALAAGEAANNLDVVVTVSLSTAPAGSPFYGLPPAVELTFRTGDGIRTALDADERHSYLIATETLLTASREIATHFLSFISDSSVKQDLSVKCKKDGTSLILLRWNRIEYYAREYGATFETNYDTHVTRGIHSISTESYLYFKGWLLIYNGAMPYNRRKPETILASVLEDAACALGSTVRMEVRSNIKIDHASGDFEKTDTAIRVAIGFIEAEQQKGRALLAHAPRSEPARDPPKNPRLTDNKPRAWETRAWKSDDGPCPNCKHLPDVSHDHWGAAGKCTNREAVEKYKKEKLAKRGRGLVLRCGDANDEVDVEFADHLARTFPNVTHVNFDDSSFTDMVSPPLAPPPAAAAPPAPNAALSHDVDAGATTALVTTANSGATVTHGAVDASEPATINPRALMIRPSRPSNDDDDEVRSVVYSDSEDDINIVVGVREPTPGSVGGQRFRIYVVSVCDTGANAPVLPGVYVDNWGPPHFIGLLCERRRPPPGLPASKCVTSCQSALEFCRLYSVRFDFTMGGGP